jgi:ribosome-binding ATPase YchF (GTP1/OBG family)
MKASVYGIPDFPFGKKALPDERLDKISELYRAQKITQLQVEYVTEKDMKLADAIVCPVERKLDLVIMDMEVLEARSQKQLEDSERALLVKAQGLLEKEIFLKEGSFTDEEKKWLMNNNLITIRPVVLVTKEELEALPSLTRRVYDEAGRICFLTGGVKEARAWELRKNATAVDAAGAIHSDLARGFIRAEVMSYADLVKVGNVNQAKSGGCLRQEGKDYIVKDGDVVEFKFSV